LSLSASSSRGKRKPRRERATLVSAEEKEVLRLLLLKGGWEAAEKKTVEVREGRDGRTDLVGDGGSMRAMVLSMGWATGGMGWKLLFGSDVRWLRRLE